MVDQKNMVTLQNDRFQQAKLVMIKYIETKMLQAKVPKPQLLSTSAKQLFEAVH